MNKKYKYLDNINFPVDVKKISQSELKILAEEVRNEMIDAVRKNCEGNLQLHKTNIEI